MSRKTKNDWLVAGYETLGESGASTLTIDHLCNRLGVTKGSFYHHFQNYQDYKEQLLAFWEEQLTTSIVAFAEDAGDLSEVLARFMDTLTSISPAPEIAIRAWALQDEEVRLHLERTDRARLEIGQRWFQTVTNDEGKPNLMARMLNSLLVGCYSVIPPVLGEELRELMGEFFRLYGLNGRSS